MDPCGARDTVKSSGDIARWSATARRTPARFDFVMVGIEAPGCDRARKTWTSVHGVTLRLYEGDF
jgi:hypothetical protein